METGNLSTAYQQTGVMPVDNYLVFYIPDKDAGIVTVIRVMYDGRYVDNRLVNHTKMD